MNDDIESAGRTALMEDALRHAHQDQAARHGSMVDLNIDFPANQTGLDNINMIRLMPEDSAVHECDALAQVRGTAIFSRFIANKGVKPGHTYVVVASDANNDNFAVGRIHIGPGGTQTFTIDAPLLTPASPRWQPGAPVEANAAPNMPANSDVIEARLEQAARSMPHWAMGILLLQITPALLAKIGHPNSRLRGLVVLGVIPGSPAALEGIGRGDVIVAADGQRCPDMNALSHLTAGRQHGDASLLYLYSARAHGWRTVNVPVDWNFRPFDAVRRHRGYVAPEPAQPVVAPEGYDNDREHGRRLRGYRRGDHHEAHRRRGQPGTSAYHPPTTGPGFQQPGTSPYHPPTAGPGFQQPGTSRYRPPTTGPGFQQPGTAAYQPPAPGNTRNRPRPAPVAPVNHPVQPRPYHPPAPSPPKPLPKGNNQFNPPKTGPGFVPPGSQ